jgi:hypothetical protein
MDYFSFFTYYITFAYKAQLWNNEIVLPQLWNRCRTSHTNRTRNPRTKRAVAIMNAGRVPSLPMCESAPRLLRSLRQTAVSEKLPPLLGAIVHAYSNKIVRFCWDQSFIEVSIEWRAASRRQYIKLHVIVGSLENEVRIIILTLSLILIKFVLKEGTCKVIASVESSTNDCETWTHVKNACTRKASTSLTNYVHGIASSLSGLYKSFLPLRIMTVAIKATSSVCSIILIHSIFILSSIYSQVFQVVSPTWSFPTTISKLFGQCVVHDLSILSFQKKLLGVKSSSKVLREL